MATVGFDKEINGKIFGAKEGETTKISFFAEELFIKKATNGLHIHTWCEEQDDLYCWSKKGSDNPKATLPGRVYLFVPSDSKELGVQVAYKILSQLEEGSCYKGKITIDGGLGVAEMLLSDEGMLTKMASVCWQGMPTDAVNLTPGMAVEVKQYTRGGGYSKGEDTKARFTARTALVNEIFATKESADEFFLQFIGATDAVLTPEQKLEVLLAMIA